jgi:hypothetical protein
MMNKLFGGGSCRAAASLAAVDVLSVLVEITGSSLQSKQSHVTMR